MHTNSDNSILNLCMLVGDEANLLQTLLADIRVYFDRAIVVNTSTNSEISNILKNYNCEELQAPANILDEGRNLYFEQIHDGWNFIIDCDEEILKTDIYKMRELIDSAPDDVYAYRLNYFDYTGGGKWFQAAMNRLCRSSPHVRYEGFKVHASFSTSVLELGKKIASAEDISLHHFGGLKSQSNGKAKRERYIKLLQEQLKCYPSDFYSTYRLGLEYLALGLYTEATQWLDESLLLKPFKAVHKRKPLFYKAIVLIKSGALEEAAIFIKSLLQEAESDREKSDLYTRLAQIELQKKNDEVVLHYCKCALQHFPSGAFTNLNYAIVTQSVAEKKEHIKKAINYNPYLLNAKIYQPCDPYHTGIVEELVIFPESAIKKLVCNFVGVDL